MKSIIIYFVTTLLLIWGVSCNKDKEIVGNSSFINGKVSFINPFTGEQTSNDLISTTLLQSTVNNQFYNEIAERNGPGFIFGPLEFSENDYKVEFSYKLDLSPDGNNFYAFYKDTSIIVSANEQVHDLGNMIMDEVPSTRLKVNAMDSDGNPLPDVHICVYRNPDLIDTLYNCNNAEKSNMTQQSGSTILAPLENTTYYIKAWGCYGEYGYDNLYEGAINSTGGPLQENSLKVIDLILKRNSCENEPVSTRLEMKAVDENGFPLPYINVCLYLNPDFADTTFNCDYSTLSQTTGEDGIVIFSDLDPETYYFKAWGEFEFYVYDNFYNGAVKSTGEPLIEGTTTSIIVELEKTNIERSDILDKKKLNSSLSSNSLN